MFFLLCLALAAFAAPPVPVIPEEWWGNVSITTVDTKNMVQEGQVWVARDKVRFDTYVAEGQLATMLVRFDEKMEYHIINYQHCIPSAIDPNATWEYLFQVSPNSQYLGQRPIRDMQADVWLTQPNNPRVIYYIVNASIIVRKTISDGMSSWQIDFYSFRPGKQNPDLFEEKRFGCKQVKCDPPCVHGDCQSDNTCDCDEGWSGARCDEPMCNPPCQHGVCDSSLHICNCYLGYAGDACDQLLGYNISGAVSNLQGVPIEGCYVYLQGPSFHPPEETNMTGGYFFSEIEQGEWTLMAWAPGYDLDKHPLTVTSNMGPSKYTNFHLSPSTNVRAPQEMKKLLKAAKLRLHKPKAVRITKH